MMCLRNLFSTSVLAIMLWLNLNLVQAANIDAVVNWSQRVEMSTTVSGTIAEVNVKVGDRVEQGRVLLSLDAARFKANIQQAKAAQRNAGYVLAEAKREWERAKELYERTVLSDRELQLAENAYVAAQARQAKVDAALTNAKKDLAESMIRAPFAAMVVSRQAEVGQTVVTNLQAVSLLTLAASDSYIARGLLPISDLNALNTGQVVDVSTGGNRYHGEILQLGLEPADVAQGLYAVEVRFSAPGNVMRAGQPAILHLP